MYTIEMRLLIDGRVVKFKTCKSLKEAREFLTKVENATTLMSKAIDSACTNLERAKHGLVNVDH